MVLFELCVLADSYFFLTYLNFYISKITSSYNLTLMLKFRFNHTFYEELFCCFYMCTHMLLSSLQTRQTAIKNPHICTRHFPCISPYNKQFNHLTLPFVSPLNPPYDTTVVMCNHFYETSARPSYVIAAPTLQGNLFPWELKPKIPT